MKKKQKEKTTKGNSKREGEGGNRKAIGIPPTPSPFPPWDNGRGENEEGIMEESRRAKENQG